MKKFLSVALAAVMMLSLAACGSSSNKAESSSEGGSASDKTYIIATDTTFAPFEFTNDKNEFVGIDVDILAAIAKDQGFKYDLQSLGFDAAERYIVATNVPASFFATLTTQLSTDGI